MRRRSSGRLLLRGADTEPTEPIREASKGEKEFHELTLDATNRRGKEFRCKVLVSRLDSTAVSEDGGLILLMEAAPES